MKCFFVCFVFLFVFPQIFLCLKSKSLFFKGRQLIVNDLHSSKTFVVSLAVSVSFSHWYKGHCSLGERDNSNSKTLFYKYCSLDSDKTCLCLWWMTRGEMQGIIYIYIILYEAWMNEWTFSNRGEQYLGRKRKRKSTNSSSSCSSSSSSSSSSVVK